jgi:Ca2+-transporting ATPase
MPVNKIFDGLSEQEAETRLLKYGLNEISLERKKSPFKIFLSEFTSPLTIILIIAALISFAIGFSPNHDAGYIDAVLILVIVILSGTAAFFQDYKAERAAEALRQMSTPKARVMRDGHEMVLPANRLVKGDIILLEQGDIVAADAKLLKNYNLAVDESFLSGESGEVAKHNGDEIYMNSPVDSGEGTAKVLRTGMQTKVGKIADRLQKMQDQPASFEVEIKRLSKKISWLIGGITAVIFFISVFKFDIYESALTAISLAVAAIPEGLPAVVVLTLAIGASVMSRKQALIRKLSVAESVGAVDVICTDKTGTLTKNEMEVTDIFLNGQVLSAKKLKIGEADEFLLAGALCNTTRREDKKSVVYFGNQTEIAIRRLSDRLGFIKEELERDYEKVSEQSFTSKRKMMSVLYKNSKDKSLFVYAKGAPEVLLGKCTSILENGKIKKITSAFRKDILKQNKNFSSRSLRVLGLAYKQADRADKQMEESLVWLGLAAMMDPPREEVEKALKDCRQAGIRVVMITGDNAEIALAIAAEIGLESQGALSGAELDGMSDDELSAALERGVNIFARTSPEHKLRILKILAEHNRVAMTGDGVNDSLALKKADVGIAMGIKGTEVAKQSSDMILLDDNFASIVEGVRQGRRIFVNIRKFINYLFTCNIAEVLVIFLTTLFFSRGEPVLMPVHILWINLLTDGLPALALGVDPASGDLMRERPRKKDEALIDKPLGWQIILIGIKKSLIIFGIFLILRPYGFEIARSGLFTAFIVYEFVRIGTIRYQEKLSWLSNKWLLAAVAGSVLLQTIVLYTPLNKVFNVVALGSRELIIIVLGALLGYVISIFLVKLLNKIFERSAARKDSGQPAPARS